MKAKILSNLLLVLALTLQPMYGLLASQVAYAVEASGVVYTVSSLADADCSDKICNSLQGAIDAASEGDTIKLATNLSIYSQVNITKAVTLDGNGRTLWTETNKTSNSDNAVLGLQASATIQNLTINGKWHKQRHGINAWHTNGDATVRDVKLVDFGMSGLNVGEQARVVAGNLTTSGNTWNAIDVDKAGSWLKLAGINHFNEGAGVPVVYVDDVNVGTVGQVDSPELYAS